MFIRAIFPSFLSSRTLCSLFLLFIYVLRHYKPKWSFMLSIFWWIVDMIEELLKSIEVSFNIICIAWLWRRGTFNIQGGFIIFGVLIQFLLFFFKIPSFFFPYSNLSKVFFYFLLQYSTFNIQVGLLYLGYVSQACLPPVQRDLIIFCALLFIRNVVITIPQNMD